ncbi:hypothetical protein FQR65_LT06422 [Abscondita terminalis]|nr:hypothetical protein FQR65_LT06422 [Abscondita terminalis]
MRVSLSVAIVAMTTPDTSPNADVDTYTWSDQSVTLSSYYWGYILPQVVAGAVAKKYGPKWFLAIASTTGSMFSILIPFVAKYGSWAVMLCRAGQGFSHGFFFPCCHDMLSKWIPVREKSRLSSLVYGAGPLGMAISMTFTGWVSGTKFGWPYCFYGHGAVGLLWTVLWTLLGKNSPEDHRGLSIEEKMYIESTVTTASRVESVATPWKRIVTSLPVWSILISSCGQVWGFSTLLTNIPRYSAKILGYDIQDNGLLSATPYLTFWITSFIFSFVTDYIISHQVVGTNTARIIMNSIGFYIPGFILLILATLSLLEVDVADGTLAMFIISVGISSAFLSGYHVNHIDIAPAHAGILMGITNGFGNVCAIIAPLIVQFIVIDETNAAEWSTVFFISSGVYIATNTFFLIFSSGSLQEWNDVHVQQKDALGKL